MKKKSLTVGIVAIVLIAGAILVYAVMPPSIAKNPDPNHTHADFAMWMNGRKWNFSAAKYMSTTGHDLDEYMHMHDGNGHVVHMHKPGLPLSEFFTSLKFT